MNLIKFRVCAICGGAPVYTEREEPENNRILLSLVCKRCNSGFLCTVRGDEETGKIDEAEREYRIEELKSAWEELNKG